MKRRIAAILLPPLLTGCLLAPNAYYEPSGPERELRQTLTSCEAFGPAQNLVVVVDPSLDLVVSAEPFNYASETQDYGATLSLMYLSDKAMDVPNTGATALIDGNEVPLDFIENRDVSSRTSIGSVLPEDRPFRRMRLRDKPIRSGVFAQISLIYGLSGDAPKVFVLQPPNVRVDDRLIVTPTITFEQKTTVTSYSLNC
ncbi:MAG: hypothetical protein AAFZ74_13155 [Pseudomonadota bacterium]